MHEEKPGPRLGLREGRPAPRLISGPEQDLLIRDMLRGDVEELGAGYRTFRVAESVDGGLHLRQCAAQILRLGAEDARDFAHLAGEHALVPGTALPAPQGVFPRYVEAEAGTA
jgi:hypothetical protein